MSEEPVSYDTFDRVLTDVREELYKVDQRVGALEQRAFAELERDREFWRVLTGILLRALAGPTREGVNPSNQGLLVCIRDKTLLLASRCNLDVSLNYRPDTRAHEIVVVGGSPLHEAGVHDRLKEITLQIADDGQPLHREVVL